MDSNRIRQLIQTEATTTDLGDFLLTHVPFENLYLDPMGKQSISEQELLDMLLDEPEEHKFFMVQGSNGSGKSHLIRWLKEKYIGQTDAEKEAVLLISRAHNTLQDALEQLLEADIFPQQIKENELKAIRNAKSDITGDELKKTINFNFILEIEADEKISASPLDLRMRLWLKEYLQNAYILQQFLIGADGPLERIRRKIEVVEDADVGSGDDPLFTADDFSITLSQIKEGLNIADGRAAEHVIRMSEKLADARSGPELRQRVAEYLNTKVSSVIQRSMKLHTADFRRLFESLRKILHQQNMGLTLFVEDINAFTGIDEALMEVLLTNHRAEGNHEQCRIVSVVGSTNYFYENKLNDSIKERIRTNIYIMEGSVLGSRSQLARFAARYINAINLTDEQVAGWLTRGGSTNDLPIAPCEHRWADVDCGETVLSIFPFNENALWNLYQQLPFEKKTPRIFLKSVVSHLLKLWGADPEQFVFSEECFRNADITMPRWKSLLYSNANKEMGEDTATERGVLLRIWGDGTTNVEGGLLGGLPAEVFEAFGVYAPISGQHTSVTAVATVVKQPAFQERPDPLQAGGEATRNEELTRYESELEEWLYQGKLLGSHVTLRNMLSDFLTGYIDWDVEDVPQILVENYLIPRGRIHIEGARNQIGEGYVLPRSEESMELLIALLCFQHLGHGSWDFTGSTDYLVTAISWLERHKMELIEAVVAPPGKYGQWDLALWNTAALYGIRTLFGGLDINKPSEDIAVELFGGIANYDVKSTHSDAWLGLQQQVLKNSSFKEEIVKDALTYFSKAVGGSRPGNTGYLFVDACEIIRQIKKLKAIKWDLEGLRQPSLPTTNGVWYLPARFIDWFADKVTQIIHEEKKQAEVYLEYFAAILGDAVDEASISETLVAISGFLDYLVNNLNLSYEEEAFRVLRQTMSAKKLLAALAGVDKFKQAQHNKDILVRISKNPFEEMDKFYQAMLAFERLLNEKEVLFGNYVDSEAKQAIETYKTDFHSTIEEMSLTIDNLEGEATNDESIDQANSKCDGSR